MQLVAIRFQIGGNRPLGQRQTGTSFLDHYDACLGQLVAGKGVSLLQRHRLAAGGQAFAAAFETADHAFHVKQRFGEGVERRRRFHLAPGDPRGYRRELGLQDLLRILQADHAQGLAKLAKLRMQGRQGIRLVRPALHQVELILDCSELLADRYRQRAQHGPPGTGQALRFLFQQLIGERHPLQVEDVAQLARSRPVAAGE
ncbi:hypothetical protein D3C81_834560 [compost metagenome]